MNFKSLHIHWKILIIIGAITVFILTLLLIVTFIYFESATKVETNEFNDFFEEFKKDYNTGSHYIYILNSNSWPIDKEM